MTRPRTSAASADAGEPRGDQPRPSLADLAVLAFVASLVFMALEMVAGRLVQRHLGSSIYGWTSVIGVLLAGLSFGNFLGGKIADFVKNEKQASWLFLAASILTLTILVTRNSAQVAGRPFPGGRGQVVAQPGDHDTRSWRPARFTISTDLAVPDPARRHRRVLPPALSLGTVSPVVAKLAVDRLKRYKRTGTAIGQVYAWGMVGSILGTFLTGFVLIDTFGTKGVILLLGHDHGLRRHHAGLGLARDLGRHSPGPLRPRVHAAAICRRRRQGRPVRQWRVFKKIGDRWGIREEVGDPNHQECRIRLDR